MEFFIGQQGLRPFIDRLPEFLIGHSLDIPIEDKLRPFKFGSGSEFEEVSYPSAAFRSQRRRKANPLSLVFDQVNFSRDYLGGASTDDISSCISRGYHTPGG